MKYTVRDLPIHFVEYGTGKPILMLHGRAADHQHMVTAMEPLFVNRTGWRRIYPDYPGMGETPSADWIDSQDAMLDVLGAFIQGIAPDERFIVVGSSYGGYLAQGMVYRWGAQIDGLCLIVPSVERDRQKQRLPPSQVLVRDPDFRAALQADEQWLQTA